MDRREFLKAGAAGVGAALWPQAQSVLGQAAEAQVARIGVVGLGSRGTGLLRQLVIQEGAQVTAVCDLDEGRAQQAVSIVQEAQGHTPAVFTGQPDAYARMLGEAPIDGVLIATPTKWHCPMSVQAMKAGKHVGSEVPAGFTIDELWELVETKEATGRRYMLLENYNYMQPNMAMCNMVAAGAFGDPYYVESAYLHDCRFMLFNKDGSLSWWGEWASKFYGHDYPTHGLGPVCKWLGINDGNRMTRCCALMTQPRVLKKFAAERFGADSPQAKIDWVNGDFTSVMIETSDGRLIRTDYDVNSPRPETIYYVLQGTGGIYDSRQGVFFEGEPGRWAPFAKMLERYDHGYWRRRAEQAAGAGHGGGDYFVLMDFVEMVRRDREPWIDVYDGASWSAIFDCSRKSIDAGGGSVEIPDFTRGRWKKADWRKDSLKPA